MTVGIISATGAHPRGRDAVRELHPDRRLDQSRQLGRPAAQHRRRGDRHQHRHRRRRAGHRLRDPDQPWRATSCSSSSRAAASCAAGSASSSRTSPTSSPSSFGVKEREGVLVAEVMKGSPAETRRPASRRRGRRARRHADQGGARPPAKVAAVIRPGQTMKLVVIRDEKPVPFTVKIGEDAGRRAARRRGARRRRVGAQRGGAHGRRRATPGSADRAGLLVTEVQPGSPGREGGPPAWRRHPGNRAPSGGRAGHALQGASPRSSPARRAVYVHRAGGGGGEPISTSRWNARVPVTGADTQAARRGTCPRRRRRGGRARLGPGDPRGDLRRPGSRPTARRRSRSEGHEVDLVMLDQRMPGEAGIDVLPR